MKQKEYPVYKGQVLEVTITGTDRIEKLELEGPAEVLKVYDIDIA